jgi:hypothetical protein
MNILRTLTIKHLFLSCSTAAFIKFFFTNNYLDVLLVAAFAVCYFTEEFKLYQKTLLQTTKDMEEIKIAVNRVMDSNRGLSDRINEVRSASNISKAFNLNKSA